MMKRIFLIGMLAFIVFGTTGCTERHTVAFDTTGGYPLESLQVNEGSTLILPVPEREGYSFVGWHKDTIYGQTYTDNTPITSSVTLFARWSVNRYQVLYQSNGGTYLDPISVTYQQDIPHRIPTKSGYLFSGWYLDADLSVPFDNDLMPAHDLFLYAKWTLDEFTLTFDSNGGTTVEPITVDYASVLAKPDDPTLIGYHFAGWYIDQNLVVPFQFTLMPADDLTLYAKWVAETYTITFDYQDATAGTGQQSQSVSFEQPYDTLPSPTRTGYTFLGWYTSITYGKLITSQTTMTTRADHVLYARWRINTYTISFDSNGGSTQPPIQGTYGTPINEPTTPVKEGHTFFGWHDNVNLTRLYTFDTMPDQNLTLYAKWDINQYTLFFETYDGTSIDSVTYDFGAIIITPDDPDKEGHTFSGWFLEDSPEGVFEFGTMPANDLIVHASWRVNTYQLIYMDFEQDPYLSLSVHGHYVIATDASGSMFGWGRNTYGQLGIGTNENQDGPISLNGQFPLLDQETIDEIITGESHAFALTSQSRLFAWGYNAQGQLGTGDNINRFSPVDITTSFSLDSNDFIISVSAGGNHSVVATDKGRVFTFGHNTYGQLGNGTNTHSHLPFEITSNFSLSEEDQIESVHTGHSFSLAISKSGRIFTWGNNNDGQLGDNSRNGRTLPFDITIGLMFQGDETVHNLQTGRHHVTLLTTHGRVLAWGSASDGQIGYGVSGTRILLPYDITSRFNLSIDETIIMISTRDVHVMALTSTGRIFAWGNNRHGQIGNGTEGSAIKSPTQITDYITLFGEEKISSIHTGTANSYALTTYGRVFTWGNNSYGQYGLGDTSIVSTPVDVTHQFQYLDGEKIVKTTLGAYFGIALSASGNVYTWGRNDHGQIGNRTRDDQSTPLNITHHFNLEHDETIIDIITDDSHVFAVTSMHRLFAWGANSRGQLGNDSTSRVTSPLDVTHALGLSPNETIIKVDTGLYRSILLTSAGRVLSWGTNFSGQLGDGTTTERRTPIDITSMFHLNLNEVITDVSSGMNHTLALTSEHRVFAWGSNSMGQLGYALSAPQDEPMDIGFIFDLEFDEHIVAIGASASYSYAMTSTGRLLLWGQNDYGHIGNGTTDTQYGPYDITPTLGLDVDDSISNVYAGPTHMGIITEKGRIFFWGDNTSGGLGNSTAGDLVTSPFDMGSYLPLTPGEQILNLSFGSHFSFLVTSHHRVFSWGRNIYGQTAYVDPTLPYPAFGPTMTVHNYHFGQEMSVLIPPNNPETFLHWEDTSGEGVVFTGGPMPSYNLYVVSYRAYQQND